MEFRPNPEFFSMMSFLLFENVAFLLQLFLSFLEFFIQGMKGFLISLSVLFYFLLFLQPFGFWFVPLSLVFQLDSSHSLFLL